MAAMLVFVPAWNEAQNLADLLEELRRELPDVDVLVVDDGSTDETATIARAGGAEVLSFAENQGLRAAIAAGYDYALANGYRRCGRLDADGQHPAVELRRLLERVERGDCDVAVGSRFLAGDGHEAYRYRPTAERALGTALLRRLLERRIERPFMDATSGLYAVDDRALPLLAEPYFSRAPEVEGLIRLSEAGLHVVEVPVEMRERAGGKSKLRGTKAVKLVVTVGATLLLGRWLVRLARRAGRR
jgi:glycosyltransferase involved in cell wall biosynthesis